MNVYRPHIGIMKRQRKIPPLSLSLSLCVKLRFLSAVQLIPRRAALCQMNGKCQTDEIWELRAGIMEIQTSWDFFFNVLLTVHLSITFVINQLNAQILVL